MAIPQGYKPSSLSDKLKGKRIEGSSAPVKAVLKRGDTRLIVFESRKTLKGEPQFIRVKHQQALDIFHATIRKKQEASAKRSIRVAKDGSAQATIGGAVKGVRKSYVSKQAAEAAIKRHHEKANKVGRQTSAR